MNGRQLKMIRCASGVKQGDVAELLGLWQPDLSKLEGSIAAVEPEVVKRYVAAVQRLAEEHFEAARSFQLTA